MRRTPAALLAAVSLLLGAGACRKNDGPPSPTALPSTSTDPLWKLAPADLEVGAVAADGSLAILHDGLTAFLAAFATAPGGDALAAELGGELKIGGVDLRDRAALARAGFDLARGAAAFKVPGGDVFVLPVGDRKAFVAAYQGTSDPSGTDTVSGQACREIDGRYVCASDAALLATVGKGTAAADVAGWPADARGHLELLVAPGELAGVEQAIGGTRGLRGGVQLERGGATLRLHLTGTPKVPLSTMVDAARSPLVAPVLARGPTGLLVVDASALAPLWIAATAAEVPETAKLGDVALRDLARAVRGDLVGWAAAGAPMRGQASIGLVDEAPVKTLVAACALPTPVPMVTLARQGDRCRITVTAPGQEVVSELWVEASALQIGFGDHGAAGEPAAVSAFGTALARDHQLALWGHGSTLESGDLSTALAQVPDAGLALWSMAHLSEFGLGARVAADGVHGVLRVQTTFANPPEVVAALEPLIGAYARSEAGAIEKIRALAAAHPASPLAAELRAGTGGLLPLVGGVGVMAAVAIPAFLKYQQASHDAAVQRAVDEVEEGARQHHDGAAIDDAPAP